MRKIIYVPTLHSSLAPQGLPEDLLFMFPGLDASPDGCFTPEGLPFSPREARQILTEMLALGLGFDSYGDLKLMAGQGWLESEEKRKEKLRGENAALEEFAKSGSVASGNEWTRAASAGDLSGTSQAEQFMNAQKALLLAWEHEESIVSMRELESKIAEGESRLLGSLGDGTQKVAPVQNFPPARPEYSWRIVLDAMSAFLPNGATLFTAFGPMIDDLRSQGMLEPMPGNLAEELPDWPEELVSSLLTASAPMWRILGYASLPADRPWLGAVCELLAAPRLEGEL